MVSAVRIREGLRFKCLPPLMRILARPRVPSDTELIRLGSAYGGWWLPKAVVRQNAVAYCAGAGEDITFDLALLERGMKVTTFDPTPRAIAHVRSNAPGELTFIPIGWWGSETDLKFFAPKNPDHVSHSAVNLQNTEEFFSARVKPVRALMMQLGDSHVDLIKMDIEGAEYEVVDALIANGPLPSVLLIDIDQPVPIKQTLAMVRKLRTVGLRLIKIDVWNYTFAQVKYTSKVSDK